MGRIKKGILGGFSGKVGTVVGANWKTTSYIRSLPQNVKNPRTVAQRRQRGKFALVVTLLRPLLVILRIGWKLYTKSQSAFNACTAYTLANAVRGAFPNFQIDYPKVMISRGNLTPMLPDAISSGSAQVYLSWHDNSGIGNAQASDKLLLAVVNPTKNEVILRYDEVTRADKSVQIDTSLWAGDNVHIYAGFVSDDGKEVSNSLHFSIPVSGQPQG